MTHITGLRIYDIFIYLLHKMILNKISTKIQPHSHQTLITIQSAGSSAIWLKEEMRPDTNVEWLSFFFIRGTVVNPLRSLQNGRYFTDDILKYVSFDRNHYILIPISQEFITEGPNHKVNISKVIFSSNRRKWTAMSVRLSTGYDNPLHKCFCKLLTRTHS